MAPHAITQLAGNDPSALGLAGYAPNFGFLRDLWHQGGMFNDGDRITGMALGRQAQDRAGHWNDAHRDDPYIPLLPPLPDEMIQKAILQVGDHDQRPEDWRKEVSFATEFMEKAKTNYAEEVFGKALDSSTSLMHSVYDQDIVTLYKRQYPLQSLFGAEANRGKLAYWDAIGPYDISTAYTGPEIPNLVESDITTRIRNAEVKFMYSVGVVSNAVVAFGNSQYPSRDVLSLRIDAAHEAMRSLRERQMLGVTRKVNGPTAFKPSWEIAGQYDYPGISEYIGNNTADPNYVAYSAATLPTMGGTSGFIAFGGEEFAKIQVALDMSYNNMILDNVTPTFALCDYKTFGIIRRGIFQQVRFDPVKQLAPGISKIDYVFPNMDGLAIVPHYMMPMAQGNNGRIYLLDKQYFMRRVVWGETYEELAKVTMAKKFVISACETFIDKSDVTGTDSLHGGVFDIPIGA